MIAIIRIRGQVEVPQAAANTLNRLRVRKKFACVIVREKPEILGMIKEARNFIAYGRIDEKTLASLIEKRGKFRGKKIDAGKIASEIINAKTDSKIEDFGLKPFFSLHPPRGGIKSKEHFPKGVLGDNKEKINDLIMRML